MNAIEYLNRVPKLDEKIQSQLDYIESLRAMTTNACSRISGMPHSPTPDRQPIQTAIAKIVDLEQAVNSDIDSLVELKQDILTRIAMVKNSRHRKLLILRFIERKTWLDIAIDMRYTERHVRRMGNEALESFESIISCPLVSG